MKLSKKLAAGLVLATLSIPAFAFEGSGTRGGGNVIDVDSSPYLMDLVTKSVCDWKTGSQLIEENETLEIALEKLDRINWYFAMDLRNEISSLDFCMTGPLYNVDPYDNDSLVRKVPSEKTRQAAYRLNGDAYIDTDIYNAMNAENKAMLIIHETMHSYLPMNLADRKLKLRSIVKLLDQVRKGQVTTRAKFQFAMVKNDVNFPMTVEYLDRVKDKVIFMNSPMQGKVAKFIATANPDTLFTFSEELVPHLAPWDQATAKNLKSVYSDVLVNALISSSPEQIKMILDRKNYNMIHPGKVAFAHIRELLPAQQRAVLESKVVQEVTVNGFDSILLESLTSEGFLIMAGPGLQAVTAAPSSVRVPLLNLVPVTALPSDLKWLVEVIVLGHELGTLSSISENAKFYQAMGLKLQKEQVSSMVVSIPRERKVALELLDRVSEALIKSLLHEVKLRTSPEAFESISKQIKFEQF